MVKRIVKSVYILIVALIVFTGALLIAQGVRDNRAEKTAVQAADAAAPSDAPEETPVPILFHSDEGSAV